MLEARILFYQGKGRNCTDLDRFMDDVSEDLSLIRRMALGDEEALRELYALHGQHLYAYALHLTNDPDAAEDVVQESLVAAWQGAPRFRGEGRAIAWLLGIVHHKALNAVRRLPPEPLDEEMLVADAPSLDDQTAEGERARWVRRSMAALPPKHRAVLELVFYQGLTLNEVARICGCPVGTVKSRLSYAKEKLRGDLRRQGLEWEEKAWTNT